METVTTTAIVPGSSIRLDMDEQSQVGAARRAAVELAHASMLGDDAIGRLAIVVTEAATNIVRHAGHGVVILRALLASDAPTIEVLALDKGGGIASVSRAMRDGYSTSGTPGHGLGAIRRLATTFQIYSRQTGTAGTALMARVGDEVRHPSGTQRAPTLDDRIGVVCAPLRGETACGDAWSVVETRHGLAVMLVDGLGHGPEAAAAAGIALRAFPALAGGGPASALAGLDTAMRGSRGAALSAAFIDADGLTVRFSGVGNVDGRVLGGERDARLMPQNGIVGHTMPTPRESSTVWPAGAGGRLVMHSDGITARWQVSAYPGLAAAHPALLAGVIYRDFARTTDDATVLVISDAVTVVET